MNIQTFVIVAMAFAGASACLDREPKPVRLGVWTMDRDVITTLLAAIFAVFCIYLFQFTK